MKSFKKIFAGFVVLYIFAVHGVAFAVEPNPTPPPTPDPGGIANPIGGVTSLSQLILKVVDGVAQIGFYVIVFFIIFSGFKFVSARGDAKELEDAKKTFLYTVIGAAILLGATLLANVIQGTVDQLKQAPPPAARTITLFV